MPATKKTLFTRLHDALRHSSFASALWGIVSKADKLGGQLIGLSIWGLLLSMLIRSGTSVYDFITAKNKSLFELPKLAIGLLSTAYVIAFIALLIIQPFVEYGGLVFLGISAYSILGLEALYQLGSLTYHLTKAFLAPENSIERNHYLQAAVSNANILFISVSMIVLIAFPFSSPLTIAFAATLGVVTTLSAIWELVPPFRKSIKSLFHLKKADVDMDFEKDPNLSNSNAKRTDADKEQEGTFHASFFGGRAYRKQMVVNYLKSGRPDAALDYIQDEIKAKLAAYDKLPSLNAKQLAKKNVVSAAAIILDKVDARNSEIQHLIKKADRKIHQSFFVETSDTIDLLESIQTYLKHKPSTLPPLANRVTENIPIALAH